MSASDTYYLRRTNRPTVLRIPTSTMPTDIHITTLLISNLHCSSCVKTVQETLSALSPPPVSIQVSIVSQSVTVEHSQALHPIEIKTAILDAGFDLVSTPTDAAEFELIAPQSFKRSVSHFSSLVSGRRQKHAEQCLLCKEEVSHDNRTTLAPEPSASSQSEDPRTDIGTAVSSESRLQDSLSTILASNTPKVNDSSGPPSKEVAHSVDDEPFHAAFFVGGMTCASCSGTITRMLSDIRGVSNVAVNLLGKSANVTLARKDLVDTIIETVEDCGFECELASLEPVHTSSGGKDQDSLRGPRTVSLRIDGMFCKHCPEKLVAALAALDAQVALLTPFTDYTNPIMLLSYQPSPPTFTIRTIMSALAEAKSPPFVVSVYHPPSLEDRARAMQSREQRQLLYRLLCCIVVAIPTFIIGIVYMSLVHNGNPTKAFFMEPMWTGNVSRVEWALFFLATPVMFYSANLFHRRSIKEIRALWRKGSSTPVLKRFIRFGSMNLLVSTGVSVAYFASIALLGLASTQPPSPLGAGNITTYFDSVVFLTMFLLVGRFMEAYSKSRTADAISSLGKLRPARALLIISSPDISTFNSSEKDLEKGGEGSVARETAPGTHITKVALDLLEVGDIVRVPAGSTPPADGTIVSKGQTVFDESSLTGESRPIKKDMGDEVFVGTINKSRSVDVRVNAIGGETMLDHIVKVVREGQMRRAPIERIVDLLTGYFVPFVTLLAFLVWLIWLSLGYGGVLPRNYLDINIGGWAVWSLEFAIAVFVVACPCGIGLAAPTALLVGSGLAAKFGILARGGGEAFQEAAQLDIIVFDKTGTLTEGGEPRVTNAEVFPAKNKWNREVVLGIVAELESASSHPLATAMRHYCATNKASSSQSVLVEEVAGRGLKAYFDRHSCSAIIGNEVWAKEHGAILSAELDQQLDAWKREGKSVVLLALRHETPNEADNQSYTVVAAFAIADPLRPEAHGVVSRLQTLGLGTWMISGDNEVTAKAVAALVGIPQANVIAGVLPHEKAEKIEWLQRVGQKRAQPRWKRRFSKSKVNERCVVAMVGDGINDSPALTAADVGIAIGSGSDVAISSAAFILISSNLNSLLTLTDLARTVFNRVKFNFLWALIYNLIALPIAAGVVYPAGHVRLPPVWASLAMALSSVSVVCSSLLLRLYKDPNLR